MKKWRRRSSDGRQLAACSLVTVTRTLSNEEGDALFIWDPTLGGAGTIELLLEWFNGVDWDLVEQVQVAGVDTQKTWTGGSFPAGTLRVRIRASADGEACLQTSNSAVFA